MKRKPALARGLSFPGTKTVRQWGLCFVSEEWKRRFIERALWRDYFVSVTIQSLPETETLSRCWLILVDSPVKDDWVVTAIKNGGTMFREQK